MTTRGRITGFVLALGVALAAPAHGQEAAARAAMAAQYVDERAGLSLEDAIARALDQEPSLRGARADIDVARSLRQQAALRPNPTVTVERRDEPTGTDNQTSVGIQWPLDLFRRRGRIVTADRELEATAFAVSDRERLLAAAVRSQYGLAAAAVRDVGVADEIVAAVQSQLDLVRARVETGSTPPLERDLLEVELRLFEAERLLTVGRADAAFVELNRLLGMAPDDLPRIRDTIEALVMGTPAAAPTAPAGVPPMVRPDVREAEARVALADARFDQAEREGRFDISLFGSYMRMDAGFPQTGVGQTGEPERVRGQFHNVAGGAMVVVPLFNRNQGQRAAARAERSGAEARLEAAELAARAEVAAARAQDGLARQAVALYRDGIRGLARQNLDVVRQTFDLGRVTVFDVLTEQRRFLEVEQAYTNALREAWEARAALKRALGETE